MPQEKSIYPTYSDPFDPNHVVSFEKPINPILLDSVQSILHNIPESVVVYERRQSSLVTCETFKSLLDPNSLLIGSVNIYFIFYF